MRIQIPVRRTLGKATIGITLGVAAVALPSAWAAATATPAISAHSIAHAKLALGKVAYTRVLGAPFRYQGAAGGDPAEPGFQQPANYTRLIFAKRRIDIYFKDGVDRAIQITTWNKAYKTTEGVGPCSTVAALKKAYGSKLKPSKWNIRNGQALVYTMGDLLFAATDGIHVTAVGLYDSHAPGANKAGGALPYAGFIIQEPNQVPCS